MGRARCGVRITDKRSGARLVWAPRIERLDSATLAELREEFAEVDAAFSDAIPLYLLYDREGRLLYQASEPRNLDALEAAIVDAL